MAAIEQANLRRLTKAAWYRIEKGSRRQQHESIGFNGPVNDDWLSPRPSALEAVAEVQSAESATAVSIASRFGSPRTPSGGSLHELISKLGKQESTL